MMLTITVAVSASADQTSFIVPNGTTVVFMPDAYSGIKVRAVNIGTTEQQFACGELEIYLIFPGIIDATTNTTKRQWLEGERNLITPFSQTSFKCLEGGAVKVDIKSDSTIRSPKK